MYFKHPIIGVSIVDACPLLTFFVAVLGKTVCHMRCFFIFYFNFFYLGSREMFDLPIITSINETQYHRYHIVMHAKNTYLYDRSCFLLLSIRYYKIVGQICWSINRTKARVSFAFYYSKWILTEIFMACSSGCMVGLVAWMSFPV